MTGNAAGIDVQQMAECCPAWGERGQVRTVVFTREGYQVAAPVVTKPTEPEQTPQAPQSDAPASNPVAID